MRIVILLIGALILAGCASPSDVLPLGEAANRAAGGPADAATGSREIDLASQVSQTGDQTQEAWSLSVQRNTTAQAAGATYSLASVAGGSVGLRPDDIEADPIVKMIRAEIVAAETPMTDAEGAPIPRPTERIDALRSELAARLEVLSKAKRESQAAPQVTGNVMIVLAPQGIGGAQPATTAVDAELAQQVAGILESARGATSRPSDPPQQE